MWIVVWTPFCYNWQIFLHSALLILWRFFFISMKTIISSNETLLKFDRAIACVFLTLTHVQSFTAKASPVPNSPLTTAC